MWSAIIWLLVLIGSTIAQYEQQTHMKSRTVQKDMQNAYGVESSLNIPPSKRKYFPAGDIPRPDFKYTKNRKRIVAHNRYVFRNNALDVFMQSNGKVKFTIRNLGPYPKYGPFSRRSLGYIAKFNREGKQKDVYTGQEVAAGASPSGCADAYSAVLATHPQKGTLKHSVAAPCVIPPASLPSDYGPYGRPGSGRNNYDGSEVSETKYEASGGSEEGYEQSEGIEDNYELQKTNKGKYEEPQVSEESYEKSDVSEKNQKESEDEEDGYEGQEDGEGGYKVQEDREEKHEKQRGKQVKYGERRGNENKAGGTGGYGEEPNAKFPAASELGHTETAPDTLSSEEQTEDLSSYDRASESASKTEAGMEREEISATQKPAISSQERNEEFVVTKKPQKGSKSDKIIPPTGKESTNTIPTESREDVLRETTEAIASSTFAAASRGDIHPELYNETSSLSQTSNTSVVIKSEQSYENTNEILTETRTEAAQSGIVGPDGRLAGEERHDGYKVPSQPGFGPANVKLSTTPTILPQQAISIFATAPQAVTSSYDNGANIPSIPALVPALPSSPAIPSPLEKLQPSVSTPIPASASLSPVLVPGPQPESLPAPLPLAQVPYFPSENTLESSQYIPAPPSTVAVFESTSAPASAVQPALSSSLLPRPGGAVPYATTPSFLLPTMEVTITAASQVPIPLTPNAQLPVSPAPQAPVPALPQAGPSPLPTSYQQQGLTETVGILPPRPSNKEKNTTLLMSLSGSTYSSNTSAESVVSKFEAGNQMTSGAIVGIQHLPYGEEVKASEQFHENHKLSKGEGQQPFEPASSGRGAQGEDEYYDSETEAPPEQNVAIPKGDRVVEQKVWSQIEEAAYGGVPKETHVEISSSAPPLTPPPTTSRYLPNAGSSYRGTFDNGARNGGFVSNLGTAQGGQQFTAINNNFASGGNAGISNGIVGRTIGGIYPGPSAVSYGDQSAVLGYSQTSFANGRQPFQLQAVGGQPFGAQQHLQQIMPSGAGGDGCCGGNWLSRNGGFCSPINFNPCLPTPCRCCCCCCPGRDCPPMQPLCQSSCMSSCCQSSNSCARRRKRTTALGLLGFCR